MVRRGKKAIKRWRESLFHSFLVNVTNAQSVRGLRQVARNLLHPIRRVCVHRENSTPQPRDVVHSPIVAQRVVTTGSNAGVAFG
jgi:ribosome maturation protein Sdo1